MSNFIRPTLAEKCPLGIVYKWFDYGRRTYVVVPTELVMRKSGGGAAVASVVAEQNRVQGRRHKS